MSLQQHSLEGYFRMDNGQWKITANHTIPGVLPSMIDWWWDHIDTTERYRLWHPRDHVSFRWLVPPSNGHVGAVQQVEEFLNGTPDEPFTLTITWEDPAQASAEYDHVLLASGEDVSGLLKARLMHEYTVISGGTQTRSHFWFPGLAPEAEIAALYEHNKQEMSNFSAFLPWLYRAEVALPEGNAYFARGNQRITCERVFDASGMPHHRYWLWSNGDQKTQPAYAEDIVTLVQSQNINLSTWEWHAAEEE